MTRVLIMLDIVTGVGCVVTALSLPAVLWTQAPGLCFAAMTGSVLGSLKCFEDARRGYQQRTIDRPNVVGRDLGQTTFKVMDRGGDE